MQGKYKSIVKYVLMLVLVPVVLLLLLYGGNKIYEYTGFYLNIIDIYNKELFAFAGTLLAAVSIMVAVNMLLQHFQSQFQNQSYIAHLDKEKEYIFEAVSRINPLTATNLYNQYLALPPDTNNFRRTQSLEIKKDVNTQREQLTLAKMELQLKTDILDEYEKCNSCVQKCSIIKSAEKFRKRYVEADKIIYNFLMSLEQYIDINMTNDEYKLKLEQANKQLKAPKLSAEEKDDLENEVLKYEAKIKSTDTIANELVLDMGSISQLHSELSTKLVLHAKSYYFGKLKEQYNSYMNIKNSDVRCKK